MKYKVTLKTKDGKCFEYNEFEDDASAKHFLDAMLVINSGNVEWSKVEEYD